MRLITFIALCLVGPACFNSKHATMSLEKMNGTWVPIKQEIGGQALPERSFAKQKLVINDSSYAFYAESVDKGTVKLQHEKMDIYGKEGVNAGKHFTAICKLENRQLTICYNLQGDKYPEAFDTKGQPMYFLSVFRKDVDE